MYFGPQKEGRVPQPKVGTFSCSRKSAPEKVTELMGETAKTLSCWTSLRAADMFFAGSWPSSSAPR